MNPAIQISTDKDKLDVHLIHQYLGSTAYWSKGRSMATVQLSIANSMCFGVYIENQQVGFARVVSDYAVFAWVMDVFVIEEFQNKGIATTLMSHVMNHPKLANLQRWGLNTLDAHGLYEKFGFQIPKHPERHMEIMNAPS